MTNCQSILEMSGNFHSDFVSPWIDDEVVPMDVFTACSLGNYDVVRDFLKSEEKNNINVKNRGGWSPLMYAAYVGHETVVTLLLDDGKVDVDVRTGKLSATALMLASSCGNEGVVYFLLQSGADINATDNNGCTALFYATLQGHQNVVKMLLDSGADIEKRENILGFTPLLLAAKEGHEGIFNLMLSSKAGIKAKTLSGEDARQLASRYGHMAIVNFIDMQSFKFTSDVRSEPGLASDDFVLHPELASLETRNNWNYGSPVLGINDGPKAFALLRDQKNTNPLKHPCIPTIVAKENENQPLFQSPEHSSGTSSPQLIPRCSPSTPGSQSNSYEDHFFATSGGTVKDVSFNERMYKLGINDNGIISPPRSRASFPQTPEYPLIADFIQDLKLDKYLPVFIEQEVDFETLLTLDDSDLKEIGINLFGPRRKIASAVANWKEKQPLRKVNVASLQNEMSELKLQLQETMLELQHQELHLKEEKELRTMVEGCVLEEKRKSHQANNSAQKVTGKVKETMPELEEVANIVSHLCKKTNDDITKDIFTKLASTLETILKTLKDAVTINDNEKTHSETKDLFSECIHNKAG